MKNRSVKKSKKCNKRVTFNSSVVTERLVRFRRTETVSIIIQSSVIKGKIRLFNNVIKCFLKKKINARHNATFPQILANFPASLNGAK